MGVHNTFNTRIEKVDYRLVKNDNIKKIKKLSPVKKAAVLLNQGEIVAFPTETVYGLGANATSSEAVKKIFKAKGRPQDNPLIVHIGNQRQLKNLISGKIPPAAQKLIKAFWPGPLTLVFPKSEVISDKTTAGLDTVAVRMPSHPVARAIIELSNLTVAAPSANSSGFPSPTRAEHVYNDLNQKIPLIIDGGPCEVGVESTVVKLEGEIPVILRPGGITGDQIFRVLGQKIKRKHKVKNKETPASPGMKYRHYSPSTTLKIISGKTEKILKNEIFKKQLKIAILLTEESAEIFKNTSVGQVQAEVVIKNMGSEKNMQEIARNLFLILRELDKKGFDLILVEAVPETGLGEAIMNRLWKAAADTKI
ncbi:MAG: L-threonylcarbamoyladenylate synthase [Halanaerobiales bacterium]